MSDLITVIIPAYNIENYISFCLRSIAAQTYENFEVLCVDDGSTDGTAKVISDFCNNDKRFNLLQKENGGVSSARNLGIDNANGKYIAFIDGDDYIAETFLERLHSIITEHNADIARCNGFGVKTYDYKAPAPAEPPYVITRNKAEAMGIFYDNVFRGLYGDDCPSSCMSLYSAEVLKGIRFNTSLRRAEDECFVQMVVAQANKVVYCGDVMYFYYRREGSAIHSFISDEEMFMIMKELYKTRDVFFNEKGMKDIVSLNARAACDNFISFCINKQCDSVIKKDASALFNQFYNKQINPPIHQKLFNISPILYSLYVKISKIKGSMHKSVN